MSKEKTLFEAGEKYEWGTCPCCKGPWKFEDECAVDSDNITPDEEIEPDVRAALSFHAIYQIYVCRACKGLFYFLDVAVVENPLVSEEWKECFFWRNLVKEVFATGETETSLTMEKSHGCITEKTPTKEGDLFRFYIGPFLPEYRKIKGRRGKFFNWESAVRTAAFWINNFSFLTDQGPKHKKKLWPSWTTSKLQ